MCVPMHAHTHTHTHTHLCMHVICGQRKFLTWMPDFSFPFLIGLARTSSTMLKKSDKSGHSGLFPDLREKVFTFHY